MGWWSIEWGKWRIGERGETRKSGVRIGIGRRRWRSREKVILAVAECVFFCGFVVVVMMGP